MKAEKDLGQHLNEVLLIIDMIINKLKDFEIDINRQVIRESFISLPFLDWASAILSNSANIISKFFYFVKSFLKQSLAASP